MRSEQEINALFDEFNEFEIASQVKELFQKAQLPEELQGEIQEILIECVQDEVEAHLTLLYYFLQFYLKWKNISNDVKQCLANIADNWEELKLKIDEFKPLNDHIIWRIEEFIDQSGKIDFIKFYQEFGGYFDSSKDSSNFIAAFGQLKPENLKIIADFLKETKNLSIETLQEKIGDDLIKTQYPSFFTLDRKNESLQKTILAKLKQLYFCQKLQSFKKRKIIIKDQDGFMIPTEKAKKFITQPIEEECAKLLENLDQLEEKNHHQELQSCMESPLPEFTEGRFNFFSTAKTMIKQKNDQVSTEELKQLYAVEISKGSFS